MPDWRYQIQLFHLDKDGAVQEKFDIGGPHDINLTGLTNNVDVKLEHLAENPNDKDVVRLKLTIKDKT